MKIKTWIQNLALRLFCFFNNFDPYEQFLIFSDPRGGSTWLTQLIKTIPNTAVIWEPLNLAENSCFKKMGFGWRQHIPENENWRKAKSAFYKLFKGKILNRTTVFYEGKNLFKYWKAKNLIIKFVNGNSLLPWLCASFKFRYKPIFLIRHPYSVISSQLNHGAWDGISANYVLPKTKYNGFILEHKDFLLTLNALEEKLAANWCLANLPTLRNTNNNKYWITINYENLVLNPENEIVRIFKSWKKDVPQGLLKKVRIPSRTTKEGSPIDGKAQLSHWRNKMSAEQINRISKVMIYFEVEFYSEHDDMPLISFS